jgi:hypothetical protein
VVEVVVAVRAVAVEAELAVRETIAISAKKKFKEPLTLLI